MDRGAWQASVQGVTRVEHDSATEQPPQLIYHAVLVSHLQCHLPRSWSPCRVESSLSRLLPLSFISLGAALGLQPLLSAQVPGDWATVTQPGPQAE